VQAGSKLQVADSKLQVADTGCSCKTSNWS
jgi:hypothetical protein